MGPLLIKPAEMMLFYTGADIHKHEADNGGVLCDGVGQFPSGYDDPFIGTYASP